MAEENLPEGTDTIISDAQLAGIGSGTGGSSGNSSGLGAGATGGSTSTAVEPSLIPGDTPPADLSGISAGGVKQAIKNSTDKLRSTASDKAMSYVSQGLERSTDAMSNVSSIIGETAAMIDEKLGSQYGDYARSAAQSIESFAGNLSTKDPEELVEDARTLVRKSPGVALAGAAIIGFALVRMVKSGFEDNANARGKADRSGTSA